MQKPAQKVIQGKAAETKKATSEQDWLDQEKNERSVKRTGDLINDAVGRGVYMAQASFPSWISPSLKRRLTVTRLYFHPPAIAIDRPGTQDELADKAKFFSTTDIAYVGIAPGAALEPEELAQMVDKAIKGKKAPQAGAQAAKPTILTALAKATAPAQALPAPAPKKSAPPKAKKAKGR